MYKIKYRALILLLLFALIYLYAQFKILDDVSKPMTAPLKQAAERSDAIANKPYQTTYVNIRDFVNVCTSHGVDVILFEPAILRSIMAPHQAGSAHKCRFLCTTEPVTTFAVIENGWPKDGVLDELQNSGYSWIALLEQDPRVMSLDFDLSHNISSHYLFWRGSHLIHLVLLYERVGQFFWHGSARFTAAQRRWLTDRKFVARTLRFGRYAGSIDSFAVSHVTIDEVPVVAPKYPGRLLQLIEKSRFIECDFARARQFYQQYERDDSPEAMLFRKKALHLLKVSKTVLDQLGVPFWISSGTCLGWFRQCDVIPYSLDVDIGIRIEDYSENIVTNFEAGGLKLHYKFGKISDSLQLAFISDDVKLDVYFFYEDLDWAWNGGTRARTGQKFRYLFPKFTLCWSTLLDIRVRVPCETQVYIEANYGQNWYKPVRDWSWRGSPANVRTNGFWPRAEWDDVIQLY